jgi:gas vesicle protein
MRDSGIGSFAAGALVGGLIGAAIGLLLAPQRGDQLREQVGDYVGTRRAAFDEAVNEGRVAAERARAEMLVDYEAEARDTELGGQTAADPKTAQAADGDAAAAADGDTAQAADGDAAPEGAAF